MMLLAAALGGLLAAGPTAPAWALESAPHVSPRAKVALISDTDALAPGQPFHLALRITLSPGWYTYWKDPGDAGAPPTLDLGPGIKAGPILWPAPTVIPEGPLTVYGYHHQVVLPVRVVAQGATRITAQASWLVCKDVCVPEQAVFHLDLPAGTPAASAQAGQIAAALAAVPRPAPFAATIAPDGQLRLAGTGLSAAAVRAAHFVPDQPGAISNVAPQKLVVTRGALTLQLTPPKPGPLAGPLDGVVLLTDAGGQHAALDIHARPIAAAVATASPATHAPVLTKVGGLKLLLLGFLGGLILNLMPCVFPVLAMKAMALARLGGAARGRVRAEAGFYALGVLVAFAGLGLGLVALRAGGAALGWGFQFQSPIFVALTAWVLFLVGLNLSGVFELAGGMAGLGGGIAGRHGYIGSFSTGLLAVVVASPCTAPFMGAAVAGALAAPLVMTLGIFLALGAGLAAPTLVLAIAPGLVAALPRPGQWMILLRQILAFPMYAAAAWLIWVTSQQAGSQGVLIILAGLLLVGFAGWAWGAAAHAARRWRRLAGTAALAALLAAGALLPGLQVHAATGGMAEDQGAQPFTTARLAALRKADKPALVNITAAWCVTCIINERLVLARPDVRAALAARHITYLLGDWTRRDPGLAHFLEAHGRDGVPLYLFYPPGGGPGQVLPQILTVPILLHAIGAG